jgi:autotransporter translocation and assembly factor TamB
LLLACDWSPLLTYTLSLSSQELSALRTEYGSPPDPHCVQSPLRIKTQVWRL